jgi:antitoxin ParD1/3/4
MNVSLTPEFEKFVDDHVKTGMFSSASEVVRAALRLMKDREDYLEDLRRKIEVGLEDIRQGRVVEMDDAAFERIKTNGRRRLEAMRKKRA